MHYTNSAQRLKLILNILVLGFALWGVSNRSKRMDETTQFENLMIDFFAPVQRSVTFFHDEVVTFFDSYILNVNASKSNVYLKKEVANLKSTIFKFDEISKENNRLRDLLEFGEEVAHKKVLARIVAWDANSNYKVLRINKGLKNGIRLQSTVVTAEGLVGYIFRLTNNFSDILTIIDPNNHVDGIVQRSRSHGIISGSGENICLMKYITRTEPVILGDLILTSGLGNIYPKGLKVGRVSRIERQSYGITQDVEISPTVDFSRLDEVVVLVSPRNLSKQKEWDVLSNDQKSKK